MEGRRGLPAICCSDSAGVSLSTTLSYQRYMYVCIYLCHLEEEAFIQVPRAIPNLVPMVCAKEGRGGRDNTQFRPSLPTRNCGANETLAEAN
jgi:hypothetical protein